MGRHGVSYRGRSAIIQNQGFDKVSGCCDPIGGGRSAEALHRVAPASSGSFKRQFAPLPKQIVEGRRSVIKWNQELDKMPGCCDPVGGGRSAQTPQPGAPASARSVKPKSIPIPKEQYAAVLKLARLPWYADQEERLERDFAVNAYLEAMAQQVAGKTHCLPSRQQQTSHVRARPTTNAVVQVGLRGLGFEVSGIRQGSHAAGMMSTQGNVSTGSLTATCQSLGSSQEARGRHAHPTWTNQGMGNQVFPGIHSSFQ